MKKKESEIKPEAIVVESFRPNLFDKE